MKKHSVILNCQIMNRVVISVILALFIFPIQSFSQDKQVKNEEADIITLLQKVDSIEHELSYLKMSYDLNSLISDIGLFATEVYSKYLSIELNISSRNFDRRLGAAYKMYYESCMGKKESIDVSIVSKKKLCMAKCYASYFSKIESDILFASCDVIDKGYNSLEQAMELLKIAIEAYNEFI